ncbi:MAG: diguanylate cyclase, partial [Gammaproteobacteria bacterium]|nr:diguanylate cyclase [Gammaproteobacteria bacterium]
MKELTPEMSLSLRLGAGFALILLLMLALGVIGLGRLTEVNRRMEQIVHENNVKVEQAHIMKDALRERSVIMHTISLLSDPFEQNEEFLEFNDHGVAFTAARTKLEGMALDPKEKEILARMRVLTVRTQPLVVQAVDKAQSGNIEDARELIRNEIVGPQKLIGLEINNLLALQKTETESAAAEAAQAYSDTRLLMLLLGAAATSLGLAIAFVVIRNARGQAHLLRHQAMYDNLTGLPNRALFADRLQQAILIGRREKQPFALIAIDLDRFKEINDTMGHFAGDRVLQHVASCVRTSLRESD